MSRLGIITAAVALIALALSIGNLLVAPKSPSTAGRFQLFQGEFDQRWEDPTSGLANLRDSLVAGGMERAQAQQITTDALSARSKTTRVQTLFKVDTATGETWTLTSSVKPEGGVRRKWEPVERGLDSK